jgi:hypothetical protein
MTYPDLRFATDKIISLMERDSNFGLKRSFTDFPFRKIFSLKSGRGKGI